ncbi:hypothetical protein SAMD00019534_084390, partial [Acytostelium subglobosum LB1]|uniref:hypothetical protein n=1 Tax=Acytostelium subglobosum LB1 TaxID=1410327 RepID=UPI000644D93F
MTDIVNSSDGTTTTVNNNNNGEVIDDAASDTLIISPPSTIDETTLAGIDHPVLVKKYAHEDSSTPNWFLHKKHFFIFSASGKPIYSRYGDEVQLNTFMATLSAMTSFVEAQNDDLRFITAGDFSFVFLNRYPLVLVSIYQTSEPPKIIQGQLDYIHALIVSLLTQSNIKAVFDAKYDLRDLLGGTDKFLDNLIKMIDNDTATLLNSVNCLRLNCNTRNEITTIIQSNKHENVLFALLVSGNKLISIVKQKKYSLKPQDIHILMNFVSSTSSFRESESWIPICLPNFNDSGFLHLYICYITPDVCLLLFSAQAEAFYNLSSSKNAIVKELESRNLVEEISKAVLSHHYTVQQTEVPHLLHFMYKSRSTQFTTSPMLTAPYIQKQEKKRLFRLYQHITNRVNNSSTKPHKYFYHTSQHETVIVAVASSHELYATFSPLETKQNVFESFSALLQWIKDNESTLFIQM